MAHLELSDARQTSHRRLDGVERGLSQLVTVVLVLVVIAARVANE
ncbi:hypothetical protein PF003_g15976 [Phytophthora fragariae]|nr:hypothetical protein PF003_g15976 [Phytophthora fragariae]